MNISDTAVKPEALPQLSSFAKVWYVPLQRPVFDPPPPPPPVVVKPDPPAVRVKLLGTVVERNQPKAMLRLPSGRMAILAAGEVFDNEPGTAAIQEVQSKQVVFIFEGFEEKPITLSVK